MTPAQWEGSSENVHTPLWGSWYFPEGGNRRETGKGGVRMYKSKLLEAPDIFLRYKIEKRWCENVHTPAAWGLHHILTPVRRHDSCQNLKKNPDLWEMCARPVGRHGDALRKCNTIVMKWKHTLGGRLSSRRYVWVKKRDYNMRWRCRGVGGVWWHPKTPS